MGPVKLSTIMERCGYSGSFCIFSSLDVKEAAGEAFLSQMNRVDSTDALCTRCSVRTVSTMALSSGRNLL